MTLKLTLHPHPAPPPTHLEIAGPWGRKVGGSSHLGFSAGSTNNLLSDSGQGCPLSRPQFAYLENVYDVPSAFFLGELGEGSAG